MPFPSERLAGLDAMVLDFNRIAPSRSVNVSATALVDDVSWVVVPAAVAGKGAGRARRAPLGDKTRDFNIVSVRLIPERNALTRDRVGEPQSLL
jgi:hypothetical protein